MSVGFAPAGQLLSQAGATFDYDTAAQQHVPVKLPPGVFAAGRVNGVFELGARRQDGREAGVAAAAHARGGARGAPRVRAHRSTRARSRIPYPVFPHPQRQGLRRFRRGPAGEGSARQPRRKASTASS